MTNMWFRMDSRRQVPKVWCSWQRGPSSVCMWHWRSIRNESGDASKSWCHSVEYRAVLKSGEGCRALLLAVGGSFRALFLRLVVEAFVALQATFGACSSMRHSSVASSCKNGRGSLVRPKTQAAQNKVATETGRETRVSTLLVREHQLSDASCKEEWLSWPDYSEIDFSTNHSCHTKSKYYKCDSWKLTRMKPWRSKL